jgi:hypothetical protein
MRYSASDKIEIIRLVQSLSARRTGSPRGSPLTAGSGLEPHPRGNPQPDCRPGAGSTRAQPAGTGGALHGRGKILCLGGVGLSASESARSHHQPGLHRHQSGRGVQGQDHGAQPALADRLQCAAASGVRDGGRSPAISLQERVANHRKRRWSKARVVSVTEKALQRRQVGDRCHVARNLGLIDSWCKRRWVGRSR